ncbi:uncharacterized protein LOC144157945 [Haemaphysalis longicornis]
MLLLNAVFLAAVAMPAAVTALSSFVCLPKPVKFDTCTSIRLLSPCQTDKDCDTQVCCKDWCGNYCAFKKRSYAVDEPAPAPDEEDDDAAAAGGGDGNDQAPAATRQPPQPREEADEPLPPPRRRNMRRRTKNNRPGHRRRRLDAADMDAPVENRRRSGDVDGPADSPRAGKEVEHEYFDV